MITHNGIPLLFKISNIFICGHLHFLEGYISKCYSGYNIWVVRLQVIFNYSSDGGSVCSETQRPVTLAFHTVFLRKNTLFLYNNKNHCFKIKSTLYLIISLFKKRDSISHGARAHLKQSFTPTLSPSLCSQALLPSPGRSKAKGSPAFCSAPRTGPLQPPRWPGRAPPIPFLLPLFLPPNHRPQTAPCSRQANSPDEVPPVTPSLPSCHHVLSFRKKEQLLLLGTRPPPRAPSLFVCLLLSRPQGWSTSQLFHLSFPL